MSSARPISADDIAIVKDALTDARVAISHILDSAMALRENIVTPSWDEGLTDPALVINQALCHIERAIGLHRTSCALSYQMAAQGADKPEKPEVKP